MSGMKGECECMLCNRNKNQTQNSKSVSSFKPRPRVPKDIPSRGIVVDPGEKRKVLEELLILTPLQENEPSRF